MVTLDYIFEEVEYRIDEPWIDWKNPNHISVLSEVLTEVGWDSIKYQLIENLMEQDDDYEHTGAGVYVKKGDVDSDGKTKPGAQKFKKDGEGDNVTYRPVSDDEVEKIKQKQGDAGKKAAANTPQNKSQDAEDGTQQEPEPQTTAFKGKAGKNYTDNLPEDDPASTKKSDKEVEKDNEVKAGIPNQKDKSLKDVDTKESDVYKDKTTGISDDEFKQGPVKSIFENTGDELKEESLDEYFKSGKIPKKYQTVITRLMNSENGKQKITDYMTGVGAGQLQSQAGEIITMAGIGMSDDEFDGFIGKLEEQVSKYPKGSKPVVTKDWLESVKHVRTVTKKRYDSQFGEGNWEIEASAWDVPNEFEALGNDNYNKNKGFSSDMYVKVSVNGKPVLDEISLKKDTTANIYNGVVTDIKNWSSNVPEGADIDVYKKGEFERPQQYGKDAQQLQVDRKILTSEAVTKNKELRTTLNALGVISGTAAKGYKLEKKADEIITKLESMPVPPPIDLDRFKQTFNTAKKDRYKKFLIMHAACQRAKEISEGNTEKTTASEFLNNHIGYEKGEDGKFPKGSIKRYENDTIQFLVDDEEAKEGCLNALANKLPMKSLLEGEEKMAIGGLSADPKTLQRVFGIDNYEDFKAGLTIKEDEDGKNYLIYRSEKPAKEVSIAIVDVRQKGQGYASSVGLEFQIAKDFGKELYSANKEEYPPEPEISDKEKRKLGVD